MKVFIPEEQILKLLEEAKKDLKRIIWYWGFTGMNFTEIIKIPTHSRGEEIVIELLKCILKWFGD